MTNLRRSGILLHPTALPGSYGVGDIGPHAYQWIDFLSSAGQTLWQVLPINPTGFADSPYQCFSAFAANPVLISPELLCRVGLLQREEMDDHPTFPDCQVDFAAVIAYKRRILQQAWVSFQSGSFPQLKMEEEDFAERSKDWLEDYTLYRAIKRAHQERPWWVWEKPIAMREPTALRDAGVSLADERRQIAFEQFLFFRQWHSLRAYAAEKKISLIGDAPIFVALDSADVWADRRYFELGRNGRPLCVAGVPPDYFSPTGQLWGNPLYRWDVLRKDGYGWWIRRLRSSLALHDMLRIDHFRGFDAYWEVPAGLPTAEKGCWAAGPGAVFFDTILSSLGNLPLIAEDLGVITPGVEQLRDQFSLPGMRILQFAFDGKPNNPYLPHNYTPKTVVYTGTHDNDTTIGWYRNLREEERDLVRRYLARDGGDIAWDLIRLAWSSVAEMALAPLQDVLSFGGDARFNFPGRPYGNWKWRFRQHDLRADIAFRLRELTSIYGRMPEQVPQREVLR